MDYHILLVEDDKKLREAIQDYFTAKGCHMTCLAGGAEAVAAMKENEYQAVLLDVMIPRGDGFELCRRIRKSCETPVLFVTAKTEEEDQLKGFALGADDYVTKPFSLPVLYAKVMALINRVEGTVVDSIIHSGGVSLDLQTMEAWVNGNKLELPPRELKLLHFLMMHKNRIFSREQLLDRLWGPDFVGGERVVDSHVRKLRKALGESGNFIRTVQKMGYKWEA